jgi:hypothetical protein
VAKSYLNYYVSSEEMRLREKFGSFYTQADQKLKEFKEKENDFFVLHKRLAELE